MFLALSAWTTHSDGASPGDGQRHLLRSAAITSMRHVRRSSGPRLPPSLRALSRFTMPWRRLGPMRLRIVSGRRRVGVCSRRGVGSLRGRSGLPSTAAVAWAQPSRCDHAGRGNRLAGPSRGLVPGTRSLNDGSRSDQCRNDLTLPHGLRARAPLPPRDCSCLTSSKAVRRTPRWPPRRVDGLVVCHSRPRRHRPGLNVRADGVLHGPCV